MVFHWSLRDSNSPQVSWTLLSIQANLNNAVVWMVSACPLISKSSSPFTNPLGIVPSALITISITVTLMFHSFLSSLARSMYSSFFLLSFNFTRWSLRMAKSINWQVLFYCWLSQGLVVRQRIGDLFVSQNPRELCASCSPWCTIW